MIGKLLFGDNEAVMDDDGTWSMPADPEFAEHLNDFFGPRTGLSVLPFGVGAVMEAAEKFKVEAVFGKRFPKLPDGVVS